MSAQTHALEISIALGLLFFVALPALVTTLVSVTVVIASGARPARRSR